MFGRRNQPEKAIEAMEEALIANPDSAVLTIYLATMYMENGDYQQAEVLLDKAAQLDPDAPFIEMFRKVLSLTKHTPAPAPRKLGSPKKKWR